MYKTYGIHEAKKFTVKILREADIFMGDDFNKIVHKNFRNCDFSALGYNLKSDDKDVYILPR